MRIIIKNRTRLTDAQALDFVTGVVKHGLVSQTVRGRQYCFSTTIGDQSVYVTKHKTGTQTFTIIDT